MTDGKKESERERDETMLVRKKDKEKKLQWEAMSIWREKKRNTQNLEGSGWMARCR